MEDSLPLLITAVLTLVSPLLTAWFTKTAMSSKTKNLVAVVMSFIIAGVYVFLEGGFNTADDLLVPLGVVYGLQQLIYNQFLKKLATEVEASFGLKSVEVAGQDVKVEAVEGKTVDGSEVVVAVPEQDVDNLKAGADLRNGAKG